MKISPFIPRADQKLVDADLWIRQITAALTGKFSLVDQTAAVRTFRWNSNAPPTVTTPTADMPIGVLMLGARQPSGVGPIVSGGALTWTWAPSGGGGAILVSAVAGLASATDYDVAIWIVGG